MSTIDRNAPQTRSHVVTRRSFLKAFAGGAAASALVATTHFADAGRPFRETGSVPSITLNTTKLAPKRFERRTPE